jgi:hypothetical protein
MQYNYSKKIFIGRSKLIWIIGDSDYQHPDKSSAVISVCTFSVHIVPTQPMPFMFQLTYFVSLESAYLSRRNALAKQQDPKACQSIFSQLLDKKMRTIN